MTGKRLFAPREDVAGRARRGESFAEGREIVRLARSLVPLVARVADGEEHEAELLLERLDRLLRAELVVGPT